jgi:hypothetical protein
MALEGPSLRYVRVDDTTDTSRDTSGTLARALRLAREVEELLEASPSETIPDSSRAAHSTRIARAMAASLVDELEAIVRTARASASVPAARKSGSA